MSRQENLKINYIYRMLYEVLLLITPLITTPYVSRVLGADGIGDYSFTHSLITYFMLFGALGTASYGQREIARHRDNKFLASKLFWEIEFLTVMTTGVCLLGWIGVIIFSAKYRYHYLALTPFLLGTMFDISWFFSGYEKVKNIVLRNSAVRILGIILLFIFVKHKNDVIVYCVINSVSSLMGALSMWMYLPGMLTKVNFRELRFGHHFHETLIYFIPTIAASVYTVLDKTLIGAITGSSFQNGYYEQATKIISIVKSMVFVAVNSVLGARISWLFAEQRFDEIKKRISHSMDFIYLLAYGSIFGIIGVSSRFVPIFFGKGFDPVVRLLYIMSPLILVIGTSNCLGNQYYTPSGQRKRSAKYIILGAFVNLIMNLILIPHYGAAGATIASLCAEMIITFMYVHMSDGYMTWRQLWDFTWKRLIAGVCMCLGIIMIGKTLVLNDLPVVVLQIAAGILIYAGLLTLMKDSMAFELFHIGHNTFYKIRKRK